MPPATSTPETDVATVAQAYLDAAPPVENLDAAAILAELPGIEPPIVALELLLERLRDRRLDLWCAGRLLTENRPTFMALADASERSEALVIKHTQRAFKNRGITPPR